MRPQRLYPVLFAGLVVEPVRRYVVEVPLACIMPQVQLLPKVPVVPFVPLPAMLSPGVHNRLVVRVHVKGGPPVSLQGVQGVDDSVCLASLHGLDLSYYYYYYHHYYYYYYYHYYYYYYYYYFRLDDFATNVRKIKFAFDMQIVQKDIVTRKLRNVMDITSASLASNLVRAGSAVLLLPWP